MNVNIVSRGRSMLVCTVEMLGDLLDYVKHLPDAKARFPHLMSCEGQGAYFTRLEAILLAAQLAIVSQELEARAGPQVEEFSPLVERFSDMVLWCVRNQESVFLELIDPKAAWQAA